MQGEVFSATGLPSGRQFEPSSVMKLGFLAPSIFKKCHQNFVTGFFVAGGLAGGGLAEKFMGEPDV